MSVTFAVDDVCPAGTAPETRAFCELFGDAIAIGGDANTRVLEDGAVHPLLAATHAAFAEHRPLVLSPDAVWLTIAQGVAQHVRIHADALRPRLVRHAGRSTVEIQWPTAFPRDSASLQAIVGMLRRALAERIGEGRARLLTCDFTTTTDVERTASEIMLLDTFSPFYDYSMACVCGIPELTLTGVARDWRDIRARIDVLAELDLEWWAASLRPIADRLVEAADGRPDIAFFRAIYKPQKAYGWDRITGWIARLYPYLADHGRFASRNPLLELPIDWLPPAASERGWYDGPGITTGDVPASPSSCLVRVTDETCDAHFDLEIQGGLMAVAVDGAGRLEPRAGWVARSAASSIGAVLEELRGRADVEWTPGGATPGEAGPRGALQAALGLPAELVALYDVIEDLRFAGWRVLPASLLEPVELPVRDGLSAQVTRFVDLPDDTFLAFDLVPRGLVIVRLQASRLTPKAPPPAVGDDIVDEVTGLSRTATEANLIRVIPEVRSSTERAEDVPVVGRTIAAVLDRALRTNGRTDLPSLGTLFDFLPQWMTSPPPPRPPREARQRRKPPK